MRLSLHQSGEKTLQRNTQFNFHYALTRLPATRCRAVPWRPHISIITKIAMAKAKIARSIVKCSSSAQLFFICRMCLRALHCTCYYTHLYGTSFCTTSIYCSTMPLSCKRKLFTSNTILHFGIVCLVVVARCR